MCKKSTVLSVILTLLIGAFTGLIYFESMDVAAINDPTQPTVGGIVYVDGDWIVTDVREYYNCTIVMNGSLTIENGGILTFRNVTLIMNNPSNGTFNIEVQSGGSFYIHDFDNSSTTNFDRSNITSASPNYHYMFWVRAGANFTMNNSEMHECGWELLLYPGLTIEAEGTLLQNNLISKCLVGIYLKSTSECNVSGNTVKSNGNYGIYLYLSSRNNVTSNTVTNNDWGIYSSNSAYYNNITGNTVTSNNQYGIVLYKTDRDNIVDNDASSNNEYGLWVWQSDKNNILENTVSNHEYGIFLDSSNENLIWNNTASSNTLIGIHLVSSNRNNITENKLSDSNRNIFLDSSYNNNLTGNVVFFATQDGIFLHLSKWNNITGNTATMNTYNGITLSHSINNNITDNNITYNYIGIRISTSDRNNITLNTIYSNNDTGIWLTSSDWNNISHNNVTNNSCGIGIDKGWPMPMSEHNYVGENNITSGETGIILIECNNNKIINNNVSLNDLYGIWTHKANSNNITHNKILSNDQRGIYLDYSDGNNITGNTASNNWGYGIYLDSSNGNNITDNNVSANNNCGLQILSSTGNYITNNQVSDSQFGITLSFSKENNIAENNLSWNFWASITISSSSDCNKVLNNTVSTSNNGIRLYQSSCNNISGNNILNNGWGIHLDSSSKNNITGNNLTSNVGSGIYLSSSDANIIANNNGTNNDYAVHIVSSNINHIENNSASENLYGLYLDSSSWNNITNNTFYLNTVKGIYLDNSNRNNITHNLFSENDFGIEIDYSNWNNITDNLLSENDDIGIMLVSSSGNILERNSAFNNIDTGISLRSSSDNNINNNSLFNNGKGINLRDSIGNNITNNSLLNNYYGIRLRASRGNNITDNNVSSVNDYGIILSASDGNNIIGNNASNNKYCIYLDSSNGNNIIENNVSKSQWSYGIYLDSSNGNNMTANSFLNTGYGVFFSMSSNNIIRNCNISPSYFYGIQAEANSHNNLVVNSSILNSRLNNIYLADNSSVIAINTTFNESKIYFDDTKSTFTIKWYMHVYVKSINDLPISNVTVFVSNITDNQVEGSPFTTGIDGYVRWIIVTERVQNSTTNVSHTPNNVRVTLNEISGYAEPDPVMNMSKVIIIILDTEKPIADAGIDSSVDEDELHMFDGSGSVDNIGVKNWTWDFGDGTFGYGKTPPHTYTSSGFYIVVLNVTDTAGNWDTDTVSIFVNNAPPIADAGNDKAGIEGEQITFNGSNSNDTASDIESLIHQWDFGDGKVGSGKIVNHSYEDEGAYTVTLQVIDDDGAISIDSITVTVNNTAPKIEPIAPQNLQEDELYTLQVVAIDVKEDLLTFSDNTTMFDIDPVTGVISFTPSNADVGTHLVNVTVIDDGGAESYIEIQMNVQNKNDAPIITSSPITIAVENSTYYYNLTVMDDDLDVITYRLDLEPDGMAIDPNGKITWTPTYQQASQSFMVIVNVSDSNDFDTQTFSITVTNVNDDPRIISIPILSAAEDIIYVYDVDGIDVDIGDWLIYSLDTAPIGMNIDGSTGLVNWVPTNDQVGVNHVVVNVTDSMGAFITQEFTIVVTNSNDAPILEAIGPLVATEGDIFYYTVSAVDIDAGDILTFSDDTDLFDINSTTGNITFVPINDDVGIYVVKITATDSDGVIDFEKVLFTINNVNNPPSLTTIEPQTLSEDGSFTLIVTATDIDLGDTLIFLDNTTLFDINPYTGEISFTPTNEYVGTYLVNITVKDKSGSIAYQAVTFTVNNVNDPPLIESIGGLTAVAGKAFYYTVVATDVDYGDTLTFSDDTELFDIDPNTGEISFTPTEKNAGVHYVTITVTDREGGAVKTAITFTVLEAKGKESYDYTWILLIIIVVLIAFQIGYLIRRREEIKAHKEEKRIESEEIEIKLEEEPGEQKEIKETKILAPDQYLPSEEEITFELDAIEEEGLEREDEETDSKILDDLQTDE